MKVSGFTFIRNARKFDYPVTEAIRSILPLCDEVIVCVGRSDDDTLAMVEAIGSDKIKIIHSVWDESLRRDGRVLAVETDKAFEAVSPDSDWALYIQGDEVLHEKYIPTVRQAMSDYKDNPAVEGLLFNYVHFYGNYHYVGDSREWYRHEIRVLRNDRRIRSYRDAQGFRKQGRKLRVKAIDAAIYHYGWVKNPCFQQAKTSNFSQLYTGKATVADESLFDYSKVRSLAQFEGVHPQVMLDRIGRRDWDFVFDISRKNFSLKDRLLYGIEKCTGKRLFEYKNYTLI
jgi:glycosyltransferase involved in cell wall biosynthesis